MIQKTHRMVVVRQMFLTLRHAAVTIQAFTRGTSARFRYRLVGISSKPGFEYVLIIIFFAIAAFRR